jgi:serine protease
VAAALERNPEVLYAEPNWIYHTSATPNDPRFPDLWGLNQPSDADIDAPEAWDLQTGSGNVIVAVVDSGVAYDHPDIAPNRWLNDDPPGGGDSDGNGFVDDTNGWDFVDNDNTPIDENGHGTHVAGTIGAQGNNGIGTTGVNWDVSLMAVRAADAWGQITDARIADAFSYACKNGARW